MRTIYLMGLLLISGCNSITFVQYEQEGDQRTQQSWHHTTLNGLVELSRPLNLQEVCDGKAWNTVKTEATFFNAVVATLVPNIGVSLYTPWTNEVECFEPAPVVESNNTNG